MELRINPIGKYITPISEKNKDGLISNVLGVAIEKEFMPSVANLIGSDLSKYSVLRKGRFAFNPMHIGRDKKLPVALYKDEVPALVSPAYSMFEVTSSELLPEFLELIMKSNEFDHLCWFHTDASVRGGLIWDDFANLEIAVPSIQEQQKIVDSYKTIVNRITILKQINITLENILSINFNKSFKPLSFDMDGDYLLSDFVCFDSGFAFESKSYMNYGKFKIITIGNVEDGYLNTKNVNYISCIPDIIIEKYLLKEMDIVISLTGNVGRTALVDEANLVLNQRVARIVPKDNCKAFFYTLFRQNETKKFLEGISKGTAQLNLSPVELLNKSINYDKEEILKFGCRFNRILSNIIRNSKEVKLLTTMQTNLLSTLTKEA